MVTKLDHWWDAKHPVLAHDEATMLQVKQIALDQEEVRCGLHREEARARDMYAQSILEVLDSRASSGFQL